MIYVGFNLSVAPNTYFRENDVIIPVRGYFDKVFRKEHSSSKEKNVFNSEEKKYRLNPHLNQYLMQKMKSGFLDIYDRYTYEIIRNLSVAMNEVDMHPKPGCEDSSTFKAYVKSKMAVAESYIKDNVLNTTYKGISYYEKDVGGNIVTVKDNDLEKSVSLILTVLLSRAEFSVHTIAKEADNNTREVNRLVPNAMLVKDIGLVATRQISNPSTIVIFGESMGYDSKYSEFENVYDENIIVEPKEIVQPYNQQPQSFMSNQIMSRKAIRTSCISRK